MPSISAFPDTTRAYVRVEINWADTPSVTYAKVLRYNSVTGECIPLRPYVCFEGDYLKLSCGHGIFWDTEVPLDTPVYYITQGLDAPCVPAGDCAPCVPVSEQTLFLTVDSGGSFFFGDPVRPCNDIPVPLCFTQPTGDPTCVPGNGVFFASMGDEEINANDIILNPTNADLPIDVSRTMGGISSVLTLVTRTFADLTSLRAMLKPGGPRMWRVPAGYNQIDLYMAVNPLRDIRGLSDHRYPVRINEMPFTQVRRPAGPSQGVCGTRVEDICDTWQDLQDDGFTWDDLLRGAAGPNPPADFRRWTVGANSVLSLGTWNAVNNGTRTWNDTLEGN